MKTLVFKISPSDNDKETIKSLQKDYSISFRKLYNNFDEIKDNNFLKTLRIKSIKQIEYLKTEIGTFYKINTKNKEKIKFNIDKLESKLKLKLSEFKHLQYLKKSLKSKPCFGNKEELIKLSKGEGNLDIWQQSRLLSLIFYGEKHHYGNRFFDLKKMSEGKVLFKYNKNLHINLNFNTKKHLNELIKLQELVLNNMDILSREVTFVILDR